MPRTNVVKPSRPVLQRGHPLNHKLHSAWLFTEMGGLAQYMNVANPANPAIVTSGASVICAGRAGPAINGAILGFQITPSTKAEEFSIFGWVKPATSGNGTRRGLVRYGTSTPSNGTNLFLNTSNQVEFDLSGVAGPHSTGTITDGNWHHIGCTFLNGTVTTYLDGLPDGSASMSPNIGAGDIASQKIGEDFIPAVFGSPYDDIRIWNRGLTRAEVLAVYSSNYNEFRSPPILSVKSIVTPGSSSRGFFNWLTIAQPESTLGTALAAKTWRAFKHNLPTSRRKFLTYDWEE